MPYSDNLRRALRDGADLAECRSLLRNGSHSFFAASHLLPAAFREPITALYAFCRIADDAIDVDGASEASLRGLNRRLGRIYDGSPDDHPVDRAFSRVVREHGVPMALPAALLEGFEWDIAGRRYETMSDVYAYSARVAGTVGAMMSVLMGVRDPIVLSRACDLGVAMQLTNIARDVGEDARAGRLYLPVELLARHGVDADAWLATVEPSDGIRSAVRELLAEADRLYARAEWGISQLPVSVRPGIYAARLIYAEIGREVERRGHDSVTQRAVVSYSRKLRLLGAAVHRTLAGRKRDHAPILNETRFLVDAVAQSA